LSNIHVVNIQKKNQNEDKILRLQKWLQNFFDGVIRFLQQPVIFSDFLIVF